jgi:hypothetical protein
MTDEERAIWAAQPDHLRIYRGCSLAFARGMSWTLDRDQAIWFAWRLQGNLIITAILPKIDALAFLGGSESEVVLDPLRIRFEVVPLQEAEKESAVKRIQERWRSNNVSVSSKLPR